MDRFLTDMQKRARFIKEAAMRISWILCALLCWVSVANASAPFIVQNGDGPGEGFNDPTPAAPVGGNSGVTFVQPRQIAFQYAANLWGATLTSTQIIRVIAFFNPLACTATSAILGSAAPLVSFANAPAAPGFPGLTPNTWFPGAL